MRTAALAILSIFFVAPAVLFGAPVPKDKKGTAEKVLGKWKLVKTTSGDKEVPTLIVEFAKDGKMTVTQGGDGAAIYEGTYKVEGETIPYKLKIGGAEKVETLKIKKLTDDELHVVDPDEIQEDFKRVVEKK